MSLAATRSLESFSPVSAAVNSHQRRHRHPHEIPREEKRQPAADAEVAEYGEPLVHR
jgi:hypothetical protein